jgi:hypothetical protein
MAMLDAAQVLLNGEDQPDAAAIAASLTGSFDLAEPGLNENTVRGWISKQWIERDAQDAPWTFAESPEDADLILPVARALTVGAVGRGLPPRNLTRREAEWVVHIRRAVPDLEDAWVVSYLARLIERHPGVVQRFLIESPWRDGPEALDNAVMARLIPPLMGGPRPPTNTKGDER